MQVKIGGRLRERRRQLNLTIEEVAKSVDITKGFLSDIERDKTAPSVATLVQLCEKLGIAVGSLFQAFSSEIVRVNDRQPANLGGTNVSDMILSSRLAKRVQVILSSIGPGGTGGDTLYSLQAEEEFVFVLSGRLILAVEDNDHDLHEGDAMTFNPQRPHTFRNASTSDPVQALFVLSPPAF